MKPEPKTIEEVLDVLDRHITRDGEWNTRREAAQIIQAYVRQEVEAWRERAITIVCAGYGLGSHTPIQEKIADAISALPVETPPVWVFVEDVMPKPKTAAQQNHASHTCYNCGYQGRPKRECCPCAAPTAEK